MHITRIREKDQPRRQMRKDQRKNRHPGPAPHRVDQQPGKGDQREIVEIDLRLIRRSPYQERGRRGAQNADDRQ